MRRWMLLLLTLCIVSAPSWADKKESYEQKIERDLNDVSRKIDEWRARSQKAGENGRKEILSENKALDEKLSEARRKLQELKTATAQSWKPLRDGIDRTIHDLHQTLKKSQGGKKNE